MSNKPDESVLVKLAEEAYKSEENRTQIGQWEPMDVLSDDDETGLKMKAYINSETKQVVIAIAGTQLTDTGDISANINIATGNYGNQFKQAITKSTEIINRITSSINTADYDISVTGHSLGGAHAQVIAHTHGLNGSSYDGPAVSQILDDPAYQRYLESRGLTAKGVGDDFDNYLEDGSPVGAVGDQHVGDTTIVNNRPNTGYIVSGLLAFLSLPLAAVALAAEAIAQHKLTNFRDVDPTKDPSLRPHPQPGEVQSHVASSDSGSRPPKSDLPLGVAQAVDNNGQTTSLAQSIARVGDLGYGNYGRLKSHLLNLNANIAKGITNADAIYNPPPPPDDGGGDGGDSDGDSGDGGGSGGEGGGGGHPGMGPPVIIDLDGDGVELVSLADSNTLFDIFGTGYYYKMGWVNGDDSLLALDIGNDNIIHQANEISFISYVQGAKTDLEGLTHFDTNNNGQLDPGDSQWNQFGIWQDKNSNGRTDDLEFAHLSAMGFSSISLSSNNQESTLADNTVFGMGSFVRNGNTGVLADVGFAVSNLGTKFDSNDEIELYQADKNLRLWLDQQGQATTRTITDHRINYFMAGDHNDNITINHNNGGLLNGGTGYDSLAGGTGDEILIGGAGSDQLNGGDGDDLLIWDHLDSLIRGGSGYDIAYLDSESNQAIDVDISQWQIESLISGEQNDKISAATMTTGVKLQAGAGNDELTGGQGDDELYGDAGNDTLRGGAGADTLMAGDGDDLIYFDVADRAINGGQGYDHAYLTGDLNAHIQVDMWASEIEYVSMADGKDVIHAQGQTQGVTVRAGGGHDRIFGSDLNDDLQGQAGDDILRGGAGSDRLQGGDGNDSIYFDTSDSLVDGGAGKDTGYLDANGQAQVAIDLNALSFEVFYGDISKDQIAAHGKQEDVFIYAGAGHDYLGGGFGNDVLNGEDGNDHLIGGLGADKLRGGDGDDVLEFDQADLVVDGGAGYDIGYYHSEAKQYKSISLTSSSLEYLIAGDGNEAMQAGNKRESVTIKAGGGSDFVGGGNNDDKLYGEAGHDTLEGDKGHDQLWGGAGRDWLRGDEGDDHLHGGADRDSLFGGAGNDTYFWNLGDGHDRIWDFDALDALASHHDKLIFGEDIKAEDILWSKQQDHLVASIELLGGEQQSLTVMNWFAGAEHQLDAFHLADGSLVEDYKVLG